MGDPKKTSKKFKKPPHPWQSERIASEKELVKAYGLKNKREIWKANAMLKNWRFQARSLMASMTPQAELEKKQLLAKISSYGILGKDASLDDVLALSVEDVLERRLQTQVLKKGLAFTPKQSRQFITHGHISVSKQKIDSPSHMVSVSEEKEIGFYKKPLNVEQNPQKTGKQEPLKGENPSEEPVEKKA